MVGETGYRFAPPLARLKNTYGAFLASLRYAEPATVFCLQQNVAEPYPFTEP